MIANGILNWQRASQLFPDNSTQTSAGGVGTDECLCTGRDQFTHAHAHAHAEVLNGLQPRGRRTPGRGCRSARWPIHRFTQKHTHEPNQGRVYYL